MSLVQLRGVMGSPFDQRLQNRSQTFPKRREQVFDPLAIFIAGLSSDHAMFLKRPQLLDQHLLRNADDAILQITSALRAVQQHMEDDRLPAPGKHTQRPLDRQTRQSIDRLHV